jgi:hypothetical protein
VLSVPITFINEPPLRLPDISANINWRYQPLGVYRGAALTQERS